MLLLIYLYKYIIVVFINNNIFTRRAEVSYGDYKINNNKNV